jgi:hypothetical protein
LAKHFAAAEEVMANEKPKNRKRVHDIEVRSG